MNLQDIKKIIYSAENNTRIDAFLAKESDLDFSRSRIKELIEKGNIFVNGEKTKASYLLKKSDLITIDFPEQKDLTLQPEKTPLNIYYEDEHMLIIDKVAGMIVHPTGKVNTGTLVNALLYYCQGELPGINGVNRPGIVHRLDKETSGLMMVAKTEKAHRLLTEQIKDRKIIKKYLALVYGTVKDRAGYIEAPIGRDKKHRNKMDVSNIASRDAKTYFEVVKRFGDFTLLLLQLLTGRTHQIRVHLKYIGYPIVGDKIYGLRKEKNKQVNIKRQALHSHYLELFHPISGQKISFTSPLPEDMMEQVNLLI